MIRPPSAISAASVTGKMRGRDLTARIHCHALAYRLIVTPLVAAVVCLVIGKLAVAADKLRVAYVAPSVSLSLPWVARELGVLAKYDLLGEILLIKGGTGLVAVHICGYVN